MLPPLNPYECRVIGVMVEKAQTTPAQYPMTVNAILVGCNQKSNRHPVVRYEEEEVADTLHSLRTKGLVVVVDMSGSRVLKYKHNLRQALSINTSHLVILTELLLRGPQTAGELRTRASRMHPLESLEVVQNLLADLMERDGPLVQRMAAGPGSRTERYQQVWCPDLHPTDVAATPLNPPGSALTDRVVQLENQVARLTQALNHFARALGKPQLLDTMPVPDGDEVHHSS